MNGNISENDLAELIVPHTLNDPVTFHRLAQVSKRFNHVTKRMLVKKENWIHFKMLWTELPGSGKKHGLYRCWYSNGQLEYETNYVQGRKHGFSRGWYLDGKKQSEWYYNDNVPHGTCYGWYRDGKPWYIYNYQNGYRNGFIQEWDSYGQLVEERRYFNGNPLFENPND